MPEFYMIFARKILFPQIFGAIPGSKAESERIRTNTKIPVRDHGGHRSSGAIMLNKLRHLMLLDSISLCIGLRRCDNKTQS